jgi:hypothetical protein
VGHVACIGRKRILKGLWWRNLKGKKHLKNVGIDARIMSKMVLLINWTGGRGLDSSGTSQGQVTACYEHGNVLSGFIKGDRFVDQLWNHLVAKEDGAAFSYLT